MVDFLRKSECGGDKIARVNSICTTNSIITFILYCVAVRCDKGAIFRAQSIYREVYGTAH